MKNAKKRLLSTLLALYMALTLLPGTAWAKTSIKVTLPNSSSDTDTGTSVKVTFPNSSSAADTEENVGLDTRTSGFCGDNVTWSYSNGVLTIQGNGPMEDYIYDISYDYQQTTTAPWYDYSEKIHTLRIDYGVTTIGQVAFAHCSSLTSVTIPNSVTSIGNSAFAGCSSLTNVTIPDSVISIGITAFYGCSALESVVIPDSVTEIGSRAFHNCKSLKELRFPAGMQTLDLSVLLICDSLLEVLVPKSVTTVCCTAMLDGSTVAEVKSFYFEGDAPNVDEDIAFYHETTSKLVFYYKEGTSGWSELAEKQPTIDFQVWMDNTSAPSTSEHIYDTTDPGEGVTLDAERLNSVTDAASAVSAVQEQVQSMTTEQKTSPTGADLATLYAETAVSRAASKAVSGTEILINKAAVTDLETIAKQTSAEVESVFVSGGVSTARYISNTITLTTEEMGEISIHINPDILTTEVDKVVVEAPTYAIALKVADFKEDLTQILTITAQDVGSGFAPGSSNAKATVKVNLPNGKTSNSVTLSLPKASGDTTYQTVVNTSGTATSSKYNPATTTIDGKVNTSGSYTVQTNQADFTDIGNKSAEMQTAIRYLAARGIIGGTGGTNYSPDDSITRAQIAALVIRALGKVDDGAKPTFKDVTTNNWYYSTAAVGQKAGIINGYEDNTYRGDNQILKEQIVAIAARVLKSEMGYKEPSNTSSYLSKYSDSVTGWAQSEVALATRENIVVYRTDGTFSGSKGMTRGDAAIIIYRLFQRIW